MLDEALRAQDIEDLLPYLTDAEKAELLDLLAQDTRLFKPDAGPQMEAWECEADVLGYGGAGGGGKSFLICGLALVQHRRSLILRAQKVQTQKFVLDFTKMLGTKDGYSSQTSTWTHDGRIINFGGLDLAGDEEKWQGWDHDLKAFDEATQMREHQVRYVMGWNRTDVPGQRVRSILTFNPPTTVHGRWVIKFFAPWIDRKAPNRAADGELLWMASIGDQHDIVVPDHRPFVVHEASGEYVYDFDPADYRGARQTKIITPKSRTFIQSRVTDNPRYVATGYIATLQQLPEPLRSQMLEGSFTAGIEDDASQLIPTAWVEDAMRRWRPRDDKGIMDSMGVDVSRGNMGGVTGGGGKDRTVIARRHGTWFDDLIALRGINVNDGADVAAQVINRRRDGAPVHIDIVGVGTSPHDFLVASHVQTIAINGAAKSLGTDKSGHLKFINLRSELYWKLREELDPMNPHPIALPDDAELLADLTAPRWWLTPSGIQVEPKHGKPTADGKPTGLIARLGRSPDRGDAVVYALVSTPKRQVVYQGFQGHMQQQPRDRRAELEQGYERS